MPVGNGTTGFESIAIKPLHVRGASRLYFNSIITEYSDSWTPRWTPVNVYGRMDPIATYGGTSRELILGFRVISDSAAEAQLNMIKIEKLVQYQYPTYQSAGGSGGARVLNSPPYFELTFMNVLDSSRKNGSVLTGYINGAIQINPGFQSKEQAQFFSPGFDKLYFSDVTVTLRMQVLHEGEIGWIGGNFSHENYPYNVGIADVVQTPTTSPQAAQNTAEDTKANSNAGTNGATSVSAKNAATSATKAKNLAAIQSPQTGVIYKPQPSYGAYGSKPAKQYTEAQLLAAPVPGDFAGSGDLE